MCAWARARSRVHLSMPTMWLFTGNEHTPGLTDFSIRFFVGECVNSFGHEIKRENCTVQAKCRSKGVFFSWVRKMCSLSMWREARRGRDAIFGVFIRKPRKSTNEIEMVCVLGMFYVLDSWVCLFVSILYRLMFGFIYLIHFIPNKKHLFPCITLSRAAWCMRWNKWPQTSSQIVKEWNKCV